MCWRVLLADRDASPRTLGIGSGCDVELLARDGVWRTTAPLALSSGDITMTGASRADFAVRCTADSNITVNGSAVASIVVAAGSTTSANPYGTPDGAPATWSATRPDYLRDLMGVPNSQINTESVRMGARTVNGNKFDHDNATFTLPANAVQEWSVSGAARHPFHLHVYHMQTIGCSGYEDGEYYDVVAANCSVRFDLNAATSTLYFGRTIMHCHILEHEDQGAMGWLDVTGGAAAPTFPVDSSATFGEIYPLGGAPVCGDMSCNGTETMCTCAGDCGTPPGTETNCTDGVDEDCDTDVDCDDSDCSADAACATGPVCGDMTCDAGEDSCNCASDCGAPPGSETGMCTGGVDDDCDGATDCADTDCGGDAACSGPFCGDTTCDAGEDCNSCGGDCAGVTFGRPSNRYCCGDGVMDGPEGDGSICDGNY